MRAALYEGAHIILTKPLKGCTALKSWAMKIARRSGMKKAKVALTRKLAGATLRLMSNTNETSRCHSLNALRPSVFPQRHFSAWRI